MTTGGPPASGDDPRPPRAKMVINYVPGRYQDMVQGMAVLGALFPPYRFKRTAQHVRATRARWRARVVSLRHAGFDRFVGPPTRDKYRAALSCRPAFVATNLTARSCRLTQLCPFCWGRAVRPVWERVDRAFFGDPPAPRSRYDLATRSTTRVFLSPHAPVSRQPIRRFLQGRAKARAAEHATLIGHLPAGDRGVLEAVQLRPRFKPDRNVWEAEVRQVFLVPAGARLGGTPGAAELREDVLTPGRRDVLRAVAWALEYPPFLLARKAGMATCVLNYMACRKGLRLTTTRGLFYGRVRR